MKRRHFIAAAVGAVVAPKGPAAKPTLVGAADFSFDCADFTIITIWGDGADTLW